MWVIKLGGSLLTTELLLPWLQALADCNVVIVPGGGMFADTVREMQWRWRFSEQAAHDMAILAMQQYGRMLADLAGLPIIGDVDQLRFSSGRAIIWLPNPDPLNQAGVPASWNITSDSLAAWLARRIKADHLLLIKAGKLPFAEDAIKPCISCQKLVEQGLLDVAFPDFIQQANFTVWLCNARDYMHLPVLMRDPVGHMLQVV